MAVTTAQLAVALRIITDESDDLPSGQSAVLDRVLKAAKATLDKYVNGDADDAVVDEATIRLSAYLYDSDPVRHRGNALVNSGAAHLLDQFRKRRSTVVEEGHDGD